MARKCKTPAPLAEVIMQRHPDTLAWIEEKMRVKQLPVDQQAPHVQRQTEGEMAAYMDGYNACLETVMHAFNCYAGYHHYGVAIKAPDGTTARTTVSEKDSEYREWRKLYYTRGIAK